MEIKDLPIYTENSYIDFLSDALNIVNQVKYIKSHARICFNTRIPVVIPYPQKISVHHHSYTSMMLYYVNTLNEESVMECLILSNILEILQSRTSSSGIKVPTLVAETVRITTKSRMDWNGELNSFEKNYQNELKKYLKESEEKSMKCLTSEELLNVFNSWDKDKQNRFLDTHCAENSMFYPLKLEREKEVSKPSFCRHEHVVNILGHWFCQKCNESIE